MEYLEAARLITKMSSFPSTREALNTNGYKLTNSGRCNGPTCGAEIEWWMTPNGKKMPLDKATLEPHWVSCPDSKQYRKPKKVSPSDKAEKGNS
jgi:hypothetical protein